MFSPLKTGLQIMSVVLGVSSIGLKTSTSAKICRIKRNRLGNVTISSRSAPICAAINDPQAPLPEQFRVGRSKRTKDFVLLESEGLLDTTVKFSIADRKALGIKNKSRQLSLFYKISKMDLRTTLNNLITNRYRIAADPTNSLGVVNLKQVYEVSVDGQIFEISLNQNEILNTIDGQSPGGENYMRLLMYRVFQTYNALQSAINQNYRSPILLDNNNVVNSRGLFVERPPTPIFVNQPQTQTPVLSENPLGEVDDFGRSAQIVDLPEEVVGTQVENPTENFTGFAVLPLTLKVLQRESLVVPETEDLEGLRPSTPPANIAPDQLVRGQIPAQNGNIRISSLDNFFLTFGQMAYAFYETVEGVGGQPDEAVSVHTVTILSRRTDFCVARDPDNPQVLENFNPNFIFSFFENNKKFERVYINGEYLLAGLEADVLRYVRYCHSKLIIYNTVRMTTYERKLWGGIGETIAQKTPLKPITIKEIPFRAAVSGTNPNMDVNVTANLMFTSSFESSLTTFYRANRFITCSAFTDSTQISEPGMLPIWEGLETALGKTIVLHDIPKVNLQACFLRGPIIECTETVQLRGLVSNAGTVGPNGASP